VVADAVGLDESSDDVDRLGGVVVGHRGGRGDELERLWPAVDVSAGGRDVVRRQLRRVGRRNEQVDVQVAELGAVGHRVDTGHDAAALVAVELGRDSHTVAALLVFGRSRRREQGEGDDDHEGRHAEVAHVSIDHGGHYSLWLAGRGVHSILEYSIFNLLNTEHSRRVVLSDLLRC